MSERFADVHRRYAIDGDPEGTAELICDALSLRPDLREVLYELILNACSTLDRGRVRRLEGELPMRCGRKVDPSAYRSGVLNDTFTLGNGERVRWGEATIEQHLARIAMLEKLRDGVQATIDRHAAAVATLRASGAKCLAAVSS